MVLYVDVETTGLIKYVNGIIELAYIIENEAGEVIVTDSIKMNTLAYKTKVTAKALEINGYTLEQIQTFMSPKEACLQFIKVLQEHFDGDKYKVVAFNADFDIGFLQEWMNAMVPSTYWRLLDYKHIDPFALVKVYQHLGIIDTGTSQSLENVSKYFGIEHIPHNCMSDITATRKLWKILRETLLSPLGTQEDMKMTMQAIRSLNE